MVIVYLVSIDNIASPSCGYELFLWHNYANKELFFIDSYTLTHNMGWSVATMVLT